MKNIFKNRNHKKEQDIILEEEENTLALTENEPSLDADTPENDQEIEGKEEPVMEVPQEEQEPNEDSESDEQSDNNKEIKLSKRERRKLAKKEKKEKQVPQEEVPAEEIEEGMTEAPQSEDQEPQNIDNNEEEKECTKEQDNQSSENEAQEENSEESEEEKRAREENEEIKAEKKAKRKAWVKANRKLIAIMSAILIVIIGVTVSHFVITRNVAFIHNEDDLIKIATKEKNSRTNLIFKDDVTVNGDLTIDNCNFDLNKYTLTVKGNFTVTNKNTANIGKQKTIWSDYKQGGNIVVEGDFTLNGSRYNLMADVKANSVLIYADEADILGDILPLSEEECCNLYFKRNKAGEVIISDYSKDNGLLSLYSTVDGNVYLAMESELALYGKIDSIYGGGKVTLYDGSTSLNVAVCKKLFIQPYANWLNFDGMSIEEYYFVEKLERPTILFVNNNDEQFLRISNVENADAYIIIYDGSEEIRVEKAIADKYTEYKLPYKDPGDYKLTVYAISDNADKYLNGDSVTKTISIYSKLDNPIILGCEEIIDDEGTKTIIKIQKTLHAKQYYIEINGKGIEVDVGEDEIRTVDITEYVADPGISNIFVTAKANGTNYTESDKELYSYVKTQKLVLEGLSGNLTDDGYIVTWNSIKGAQAYEISVYDESGKLIQNYITTGTSIILDEKADVRVRPLGSGYYKDGDEVKVPDTVTPETPATND